MSVTPLPPPDRRQAATDVLAAKRRLGLRWAELGQVLGLFYRVDHLGAAGPADPLAEDAEKIGAALELDAGTVEALTLTPERGAGVVDTSDPLVYRLQEMVQVYGTTIAECSTRSSGTASSVPSTSSSGSNA